MAQKKVKANKAQNNSNKHQKDRNNSQPQNFFLN